MVLAFVLGFVAVIVKSDLKLPSGLYTSISIYLLFAIGLKGGVALSQSNLTTLVQPILATLALSVVTPSIAYFLCRKVGRLGRVDSSALAAHYGSVSAVTFIAALTFAQVQNLEPEGYLPALVAILEVPAILIAIALVMRKEGKKDLRPMLHELLTGRAVVLLVGGLIIGWICGPEQVKQVQPLFGDLSKGALTIFLLEMALVAGERISDLKESKAFLIGFGTILPVVNGAIGAYLGSIAGMSVGGAGVLGMMAASASYIAAPAAVRIALPEAKPGLYLTSAIAITFPFNLVLGIPLIFQFAQWFAR